jgi:hypothetical protein
MKEFIKDLIKNPKKLLIFLIPIIMQVLLVIYLFPDEHASTSLKIGSSVFMALILFLLILQRWREYKGYEGLFGRK